MKPLENRSLDRGITIMEVLARLGACSLTDIHKESGIPISTIRRLLGTLCNRRIVHRSLSDRKYRINITLSVSTSEPLPLGMALLVDISMPILTQLTSNINWPSDLHIVDGASMRVVDSTRPLSPYHLYRGIVNRCVNIFGAATGQACLSIMEDDQILKLAEETEDDKIFGLSRVGYGIEDMLGEISAARARGYGVRLASYLGETVLDDRLDAIAVSVGSPGGTLGAINLLFPRGLMSSDSFAELYLEPLKNTADKINRDLLKYSERGVVAVTG